MRQNVIATTLTWWVLALGHLHQTNRYHMGQPLFRVSWFDAINGRKSFLPTFSALLSPMLWFKNMKQHIHW